MSDMQGRFIQGDPADGPPPEAYSRVTNPERFAPLHGIAVAWIERLEREFDATSSPFDDSAMTPRKFDRARPSIIVTPRTPTAAPIAFAFTTFPSLIVRFGRWSTLSFPECACDACGSTAEREQERLDGLIAHVLAGRFREEIRVPLLPLPPLPFTYPPGIRWTFGEVWTMKEMQRMMRGGKPPDPERMRVGGSAGGRAVDRKEARRLIAGGPKSHAWKAWTRAASQTR